MLVLLGGDAMESLSVNNELRMLAVATNIFLWFLPHVYAGVEERNTLKERQQPAT